MIKTGKESEQLFLAVSLQVSHIDFWDYHDPSKLKRYSKRVPRMREPQEMTLFLSQNQLGLSANKKESSSQKKLKKGKAKSLPSVQIEDEYFLNLTSMSSDALKSVFEKVMQSSKQTFEIDKGFEITNYFDKVVYLRLSDDKHEDDPFRILNFSNQFQC